MTINAPAPPPTVIVTDLRCVGCGYNLRGLESSARCPECGAATPTTDSLAFADRAWLRQMRNGARLLMAAILFVVLGWIVMAALVILLTTSRSANFNPLIFSLSYLVLTLLSYLFYCAALHAASKSNPIASNRWTKRLAIGMTVAFLPTVAFSVPSPLIAYLYRQWLQGLQITQVLGLVALILMAMAAWGAVFARFALCMQKTPQPALARAARVVAWAPITLGLAFSLTTAIRSGMVGRLAVNARLFVIVLMFLAAGAAIVTLWLIARVFNDLAESPTQCPPTAESDL